MNIYILSRSPKSYSTSRLKEAARERGHIVRILDTLKFSIFIEKGKPYLYYDGKSLRRCDAVIPRIGASITFFGTAVVRHFEQMGTFTLNTSHAISVSRDKLRASQIFSRHSIGMPPSAFIRDQKNIIPAIDKVGGAPVVVKLLEGTQGKGVILANSKKTAQAILETFQSTKQNVLIQQFVSESRGRDIRSIVVGGRVVASMRRIATGDEFRSNVHRGGTTEVIELDPEYESAALKAAQVMGLRVAGVDMLESKSGPQVMEVNSSPGLEGIEKATGLDIAGEMIAHIEEQVDFPDIDVRQRLTLKAGYSVTEIPIIKKSSLANKTIQESELREKDIMVLSITRGSVSIPNPRKDRVIYPGDILLCYGKTIALKQLIPPKKKRRKKKLPPAGRVDNSGD